MKSLGINPNGKSAENINTKECINNFNNTNNIFPFANNLNQDDGVILNKHNPPNSFREVSLAFSKRNICRILKVFGIAYNDVSSTLAKYGKYIPVVSKEMERVVRIYSDTHDFNKDVVTSFINMCKEGIINNVFTYYMQKANSKSKRNSSIIGVENIICNFNVDNFRKICFGISPDNMNFNPLEDKEMFIVEDYVRIYWNLYMLLVFYKICVVTQDNENSFFELFHSIIGLAMIVGMKMFVQLELAFSYGELYEELKGFKTINSKYLFSKDLPDKQQVYFTIKNADFLNEAYRNEYNNPNSISKTKDVKEDKHADIELCIKKGSINNSVLFEAAISGQNPIGRIYSCETDPNIIINFENIYNYCPTALKPTIYLFRQVLNYSKDNNISSYYTELQTYLKKFKGKRIRNFVPKYLSKILLIIYKRANKEELEEIINMSFKTTDKVQKAEFRKIYNELEITLKPKKERVVDRLRKELWKYVW